MKMIFIVWTVFIYSEQKTNLNLIKKVYENEDFCDVLRPSENAKILMFKQYRKSDQTPSINYKDLESLI